MARKDTIVATNPKYNSPAIDVNLVRLDMYDRAMREAGELKTFLHGIALGLPNFEYQRAEEVRRLQTKVDRVINALHTAYGTVH